MTTTPEVAMSSLQRIHAAYTATVAPYISQPDIKDDIDQLDKLAIHAITKTHGVTLKNFIEHVRPILRKYDDRPAIKSALNQATALTLQCFHAAFMEVIDERK